MNNLFHIFSFTFFFFLMGSMEVKGFPQIYLSYELDSLKKAYTAAGPRALEAQASL